MTIESGFGSFCCGCVAVVAVVMAAVVAVGQTAIMLLEELSFRRLHLALCFCISNEKSFTMASSSKKAHVAKPLGPFFIQEEINGPPVEDQAALAFPQQTPKHGREEVQTEDGLATTATEAEIIVAAKHILCHSGVGSSAVFECCFHAHFGCSPWVAAQTWDLLQQEFTLEAGHTMEHFLWGLMLMMVYSVEEVNCTMASGVDEQTFCYWAWDFVEKMEKIAQLEPVIVSF